MHHLGHWHTKIIRKIQETREALEMAVEGEEEYQKILSCRLGGLYRKLENLEKAMREKK